MSYESFHHRLLLSFWHIELSNLPVGVLEHRRLAPEEAKALIGAARQHNSLLCLSTAVRIPRSFGRAFHNHSATHSTRIRPLIPRPFGHPQAGASQVNFNLPSTLFGRRSRDGEIDDAKRKRSAPAQAGL